MKRRNERDWSTPWAAKHMRKAATRVLACCLSATVALPGVAFAQSTPAAKQRAVVESGWTITPGFSYAYSNQKNLVLNGLLAVGAILIGNINVTHADRDIFTFNLQTSYSATDRLQWSLNVPFLARNASYIAPGDDEDAGKPITAYVHSEGLGDVSTGIQYQLRRPTQDVTGVMFNLQVKAPTGKDPYGIPVKSPGDTGNLTYPDGEPTGTGTWAAGAGVSFIQPVDPAVLFWSLSYNHNWPAHFSEIHQEPGSHTSGYVAPGDAFTLSGGVSLAFNPKASASISFQETITQPTRVRLAGDDGSTVPGSRGNTAVLNLGVTYAFDDRSSMIVNLGVGITDSAPAISLGVRFPRRF